MDTQPPATVAPDELVALFYRDASQLGAFERRDASACPPRYRAMLAHGTHMTLAVERRHGCAVDVDVLDSAHVQGRYQRKILLRRQADRHVVQFAIVRLSLAGLEPRVRTAIVSQQAPLGRILVEHAVMRRVTVNALWHVQCGAELATHFGVAPGYATYGRTASIRCAGEAGVELLEILAPEDSFDD